MNHLRFGEQYHLNLLRFWDGSSLGETLSGVLNLLLQSLSGFRVQGLGAGSRVQGSGFRVQGSGFRVQGECKVTHRRRRSAGAGVEGRCRANLEHIRQSRPDSGLDFQVKVLATF